MTVVKKFFFVLLSKIFRYAHIALNKELSRHISTLQNLQKRIFKFNIILFIPLGTLEKLLEQIASLNWVFFLKSQHFSLVPTYSASSKKMVLYSTLPNSFLFIKRIVHFKGSMLLVMNTRLHFYTVAFNPAWGISNTLLFKGPHILLMRWPITGTLFIYETMGLDLMVYRPAPKASYLSYLPINIKDR